MVLSDHTGLAGAPPNCPNYDCITWSTSDNWIGINLAESNATALLAYSDPHCQNMLSFIECPSDADCDQGQFCVKQKDNGGAGSWQSVLYREP